MKIKSLLTPNKISMIDFDTVNPISIISMFLVNRRVIYDRYGILNKYSSLSFYEPPKPPSINDINYRLEFEDLMNKRAQNIIDKNKGKKIIIACSGGVDSVGILVSFLKCKNIKNDIIIFSNDMLNNIYFDNQLEGFKNEYPKFYNELKKENYQFIENSENFVDIVNNLDNDFVLISGDCCDQLFNNRYSFYNQMYFIQNWKDCVSNILKKCYKVKFNIDEYIAIYEDWIKKSVGLDIKTFGQFTWFLDFALKFEPIKYDIAMLYGEQMLVDRLINFYDTNNFQLYSLQNFDTLHNVNPFIPQNSAFYKKELKEYIWKYNKDNDYLLYKNKQPSYLLLNDINKVVVLDDKNKLYNLKLEEELRQFNIKLYFKINHNLNFNI